MQYPHWLMIAGAVLVVLGFIALALRQKRDVEPDDEQTEMKANGNLPSVQGQNSKPTNETGETQTLPSFPLGHGARQPQAR
jgi:hypothetical protein